MNRVDLQDRQMKDGDVSVILNNVMINDTGTYECHTFMEKTKSWENISIISLSVVDPPGQTGGDTEDGGNKYCGLIASVLLLLGLVVVALVIATKLPKKMYHLPSDESADICSDIRVSGG
ncbi:unnamed protein product [Oreochromis niloticus]|nr:unnamed protein product [Mustela putorius furo]